MKNGCIFLLLLLIGSSVGYYFWLAPTSLGANWWIGPLLGLSVTLAVSNILGIFIALKQKAAAAKSPSEWRDGELVGVCGAISAARPIVAPFSGKSAAMVEYEINKMIPSSEGSDTKQKQHMGFMMAPCTVQTLRGAVKVVGFPLLTEIFDSPIENNDCYRKAAEFLIGTKFEPMSSNPIKLISQINAVLKDDDGDVQAHFGGPVAWDMDTEVTGSAILPDDEDLEDADIGADASSVGEQSILRGVDALAADLRDRGLQLEEKVVPIGAEVTIFGSYRANRQAIDIGSGLSNLSHSIQRGKIDQVIGKTIIKSIIASVIFAAISAAGHYYVLKQIGLIAG